MDNRSTRFELLYTNYTLVLWCVFILFQVWQCLRRTQSGRMPCRPPGAHQTACSMFTAYVRSFSRHGRIKDVNINGLQCEEWLKLVPVERANVKTYNARTNRCGKATYPP